ncbi:protein IL-40 [Orycteropus afer afer]|uniref:Protein IL-40 n=1 Tax=Orycteropus afer afer TaxID=1230840 RepID=A0A8B7BDF8_ORYAF|nr:protein IL-40 [Orycteropus afer afer]
MPGRRGGQRSEGGGQRGEGEVQALLRARQARGCPQPPLEGARVSLATNRRRAAQGGGGGGGAQEARTHDKVPKPSAAPLTSALPAPVSRPGIRPGVTPDISIDYKVLEVFPKGRRVLITCHSPQVPLPVTYTLWGSQNIEVAKKVVKTSDAASFNINITLKSRPDLLTYSCQASLASGVRATSARLQMYWELWANPVSPPEASFTLIDRGSGPRVEVTCQTASGSPPITYSLMGKDGHIYRQQSPPHGQPANFSFLLPRMPAWLQCQAENSVSFQSSAFTLLPPGELPQGPAFVLATSLTSIAAVGSGMLGWTAWTR